MWDRVFSFIMIALFPVGILKSRVTVVDQYTIRYNTYGMRVPFGNHCEWSVSTDVVVWDDGTPTGIKESKVEMCAHPECAKYIDELLDGHCGQDDVRASVTLPFELVEAVKVVPRHGIAR